MNSQDLKNLASTLDNAASAWETGNAGPLLEEWLKENGWSMTAAIGSWHTNSGHRTFHRESRPGQAITIPSVGHVHYQDLLKTAFIKTAEIENMEIADLLKEVFENEDAGVPSDLSDLLQPQKLTGGCVIEASNLDRALELRQQALELLKRAQELDGLKPVHLCQEQSNGFGHNIVWLAPTGKWRSNEEKAVIANLAGIEVDVEDEDSRIHLRDDFTLDELTGADPQILMTPERIQDGAMDLLMQDPNARAIYSSAISEYLAQASWDRRGSIGGLSTGAGNVEFWASHPDASPQVAVPLPDYQDFARAIRAAMAVISSHEGRPASDLALDIQALAQEMSQGADQAPRQR